MARHGERRSKCSGERLPTVQSGKKQGKRPGKEPHLNVRLWAREILAEQRWCSSYAAAVGRRCHGGANATRGGAVQSEGEAAF